MIERRPTGGVGEDAAVEFLRKKGYRILERTFRFGRGEIDIIAEDAGVLVFVEVKARRSDLYGDPEDAVTPGKRRQIRRVAEGYMHVHDIDDRECRCDVIAIEFLKGEMEIRHIEDAF